MEDLFEKKGMLFLQKDICFFVTFPAYSYLCSPIVVDGASAPSLNECFYDDCKTEKAPLALPEWTGADRV